MITRALVLAPRLTLKGEGQLSPALVSRIRRALEELDAAGCRDVCVVDGARAQELAIALGEFPGLNLVVTGNRSWRQAGGAALRHSAEFLKASDQPCLILSGDRPIDRKSLRLLLASAPSAGEAVLLVAESPGTNRRAAVVDLAKVRLDKGRVAEIGYDLEGAETLSAGHAVIHASLLETFSHLNNPSLEEALRPLVAQGRVSAVTAKLAWPGGPEPVEVRQPVEAILDSKAHPRYTLLNPGPVNTTPRVKSALVHHDVCHRDESFSELLVGLSNRMRRVFRAEPDYSVCLITGSGTAAMECAISSTVPQNGKILIVENGAFGARLVEIARVHQLDVVHLCYAWGEQVQVGDIEAALAKHPDITTVAMIHHETSVGLLNPIGEIGPLVRAHDALFIVDVISSLGAEDIDVVRDQIDVCFGSANKCLHAVSGVGFVCVAPRVWARINGIRPRSYYLDLRRYKNYADELAQTPFTPAVSSYFALDAAVSEFLDDGHEKRFALYRRRNQRIRDGLRALGMLPFTETGAESHSVSTVSAPAGIDVRELYDRMRDKGFIIYACKGILAERFLQIANMGDLEEAQIERFLRVLGEVIASFQQAAAVAPTPQQSLTPAVKGRRI